MPDFLGSPSGRRVAADGTVTYDFEGHVCAQGGLDLIAGDDIAPLADRKIIWHRDSCSGAVVAELVSTGIGGANSLRAVVPSPDGSHSARLDIIGDNAGESAIQATVGGFVVNVLLVNGRSAFVQAKQESLRVVRGIVNADGTEAAGAGFGYSVAKLGTGEYRVTFDTAFAGPPSVACWPRIGGRQTPEDTEATTAAAFRTSVRDSAGVLVNVGFHFQAMGPV